MAEKMIGRYEIQGELGRGAMGLVYKAYDPVLERHAAIKVMTTSGEMDDELRARFFREARSAARLSNPHIIAIYDMGDDQNRPFIAMEFVEGEDLKALIRQRGFVPFARKLEVISQICRALHYAHKHGVIHRDIKPGNVRLTMEGQVKILDFGLARLGASDMTRTGTLMGTPYYMSPEQARGAREIDGRSDLFSVGVILYEFLCYRRPFEADSPTAVCYQIIAEPHSPLSTYLPGCAPELEAILEKALAKDPAKRFATGEEMAAALADFAAQLPEKETALLASVTEIEAEVERQRAEAQQNPLYSLLDPALLDDTLFPQSSDAADLPQIAETDHLELDYGRLLQRKAQLEKAHLSMVRDLEKIRPMVESFDRCKQQLEAEQWDDCLANVREMLKSFPRNPDLLAMEKKCIEGLDRKQRELERQERERRQKAEQELRRREQLHQLMEEGRQALARGDYGTADSKAEQALALEPDSNDARELQDQAAEIRRRLEAQELMLEAQNGCRNGRFSECRKLIDKGLALAPEDTELKALREKLDTLESLVRQASNSLERGALEEALEIAGHALEVEPEQSAANEIRKTAAEMLERRKQIRQMRAEAEALLAEGRYEECIEVCRAGLRLGGENNGFRRLEKQATSQLKKQKQAEELLANAREHLRARNYEEAERQSKGVLELAPENAEALETVRRAEEGIQNQRRLGEIVGAARKLFGAKRWRECLDVVAEGFRIEPGNQELAELQRRSSEALERSSKVEKFVSEASGFLKQGDYERALKASEQALSLDPECQEAAKAADLARSELERRRRIEAAIGQARAACEKRDFQTARELAVEGISLAANSPHTAFKKELERLLARAEQGLAVERQIGTLLQEGRAHFEKQRFPDVLQTVREILSLAPSHTEALRLEKSAKEAIREAERRIKLESSRAAARTAQKKGDAPACLKAATDGLAEDSGDADLEGLRGWAERVLQEQRAEEERRERVAKLLASGKQDLSGKRLRRARRRFNELLRLEPDHAEALTAKAEIDSALAAQNQNRTRLASYGTAGLLVLLGMVWVLRDNDVAGVRSDTPPVPVTVQKAPEPAPSLPSSPSPAPAETPRQAEEEEKPADNSVGEKMDEARNSLRAKDYAAADRLATEALALSSKDSKALEIQRQARRHLSEISRSKTRVRQLIGAGKYPEAQATLASLRELAGPDPEIQELSAQLQARSRQAADSARNELEQTRQRAEKPAAEAGVSLASAERLDSQAASLYQSGDYAASAARFSQARDAYLDLEKKAAEVLQGRAIEGQRQAALSAKRSFDRQQGVAEQVNAQSLASNLFSRAKTAGSNAELRLQQNDFATAQKGFQDAENLMEQAAEAAKKAGESRVTERPADEAAGQRQLAQESQRRLAAAKQGFSGEDSVAAAEETKAQQLLKEGRWADASAAFENAARRYQSSKSASAALDRVIRTYAAAFSGKDLDALRTLWPAMDQSNLQSFRSTFEINEAISLSFTPVRFSFDDEQAVVVCSAELSLTPKGEKREVSRVSETATFRMARKGDSWAIQSFVGNFRSR